MMMLVVSGMMCVNVLSDVLLDVLEVLCVVEVMCVIDGVCVIVFEVVGV